MEGFDVPLFDIYWINYMNTASAFNRCTLAAILMCVVTGVYAQDTEDVKAKIIEHERMLKNESHQQQRAQTQQQMRWREQHERQGREWHQEYWNNGVPTHINTKPGVIVTFDNGSSRVRYVNAPPVYNQYGNHYYQTQPVYQTFAPEQVQDRRYDYDMGALRAISAPVDGRVFGTWIYSKGNDQRKIVGYYANDRLFLRSFRLDGTVEDREYSGQMENGLSQLRRIDGNSDGFLTINQDGQLEFWQGSLKVYAAQPL
jgi:hypothetical protein